MWQVDPFRDIPLRSLRSFERSRTPAVDRLIFTLSSQKDRKASGVDGLPDRMLKEGRLALAFPLQGIIEKIIASGCYPKSLKISLLRPVLKSGSQVDINNYRPISLLSVKKVVKRIVCEQLTEYLETNNLLNRHQFGFRRGKGMEDAASAVTNYIT